MVGKGSFECQRFFGEHHQSTEALVDGLQDMVYRRGLLLCQSIIVGFDPGTYGQGFNQTQQVTADGAENRGR